MCSQPPKDVDDSGAVAKHLRLISLIENQPEVIGITGGEPTLLGAGLVTILRALSEKLPTTYVHMLTNGRRYSDGNFTRKMAEVGHSAFTSAIPLYSDTAGIHDYVVQAEGAFDETVEGLYNCAESGLAVEIRVVLHKQTYSRLPQLAEFIYRNFPFVNHVALMGMEHMGYVKKNWDDLWIDPTDYMSQLEQAVRILHCRKIRVSVYNLQLCLMPRSLWGVTRQSISDFKNIYLDECEKCQVKNYCPGLFLSQERLHSPRIRAVN
jgi:His-Xaa-Ser system radical SAM maturase HxsC